MSVAVQTVQSPPSGAPSSRSTLPTRSSGTATQSSRTEPKDSTPASKDGSSGSQLNVSKAIAALGKKLNFDDLSTQLDAKSDRIISNRHNQGLALETFRDTLTEIFGESDLPQGLTELGNYESSKADADIRELLTTISKSAIEKKKMIRAYNNITRGKVKKMVWDAISHDTRFSWKHGGSETSPHTAKSSALVPTEETRKMAKSAISQIDGEPKTKSSVKEPDTSVGITTKSTIPTGRSSPVKSPVKSNRDRRASRAGTTDGLSSTRRQKRRPTPKEVDGSARGSSTRPVTDTVDTVSKESTRRSPPRGILKKPIGGMETSGRPTVDSASHRSGQSKARKPMISPASSADTARTETDTVVSSPQDTVESSGGEMERIKKLVDGMTEAHKRDFTSRGGTDAEWRQRQDEAGKELITSNYAETTEKLVSKWTALHDQMRKKLKDKSFVETDKVATKSVTAATGDGQTVTLTHKMGNGFVSEQTTRKITEHDLKTLETQNPELFAYLREIQSTPQSQLGPTAHPATASRAGSNSGGLFSNLKTSLGGWLSGGSPGITV